MRSVSKADRELIERASVTASQLERWRRAGVFPRAHREYGGTRGGRSAYPAWAVDQARELARLTGRGKTSLFDVALIMFVRRRWVREDQLRAALQHMLDRELSRLAKHASADDPFDAAELFASELDRDLRRSGVKQQWKARINSSYEAPLHSALTCMAQIFITGEPTYDAALSEPTDATGAASFASETLALDRGQTADTIKALLSGPDLSLKSLRRFAGEVRIAETEWARDFLLAERLEHVGAMSEEDIALAALGIAAIRRFLGAPSVDPSADNDNSPPQPRQRPGGMAHGEDGSACALSVSPPPRAASP